MTQSGSGNSHTIPWQLRLAGRASDSWGVTWAAAILCRGLRAALGDVVADRVRLKLVNLLGYPFHRAGVKFNMHSTALALRIRGRMLPLGQTAKRKPVDRPGPLRIGIVGEMTFGGARSLDLIHQFPSEHELYVFDTGRGGVFGDVPERPNLHVIRHNMGGMYDGPGPKLLAPWDRYEKSLRSMVEDINRSGLDILIIANASFEERWDIASLSETPCILGYLMGAEPLFHPKVDYCFYGQLRVGFPVVGNRLFSAFTRRPLPAERCCLETGYPLEAAAMDRNGNPPWEQREPLIVFHGRLALLQESSFLETLCSLLADDLRLRLALLGKGDNIGDILGFFSARGLGSQVDYLGYVDKSEYATGAFHDKIFEFLRRGRLEPNPWPMGGGISRVEAYLADTPTVNLRFPVDGGDPWAGGQTTEAVPDLDVPSSTAGSLEEYLRFCRGCLYDREFAEKVIAEQRETALRVTDTRAWWGRVVASYHDWLHGTGWAAADGPAGGRRGSLGEAGR